VKRAIVLVKAVGAKVTSTVSSPIVRSVTGIFAGGSAIAVGAGLVFVPAGLILGGAELVAYCLILVDVDRKEK
jgi:hypothetical protein